MEIKNDGKKLNISKLVYFGLIALASILLFTNLSSIALWQDEGEVAILAKNILRTGLPVVDTGRQIFSILGGEEYNEAGIWTYHPWLSHYFAAASILLFGESTSGARMIFVIVALFGFIASLELLKKLCSSNKEFYLAAFFLIVNVSFFLHARQVRYYGLLFLLTPLLLYFYLKLLENPNKINASFLFASATLLFYTNGLSFFAITAPLVLHFLIEGRKNILAAKYLVFSAVATAFLAIPWIIYAKPAMLKDVLHVAIFSKLQALFYYFAFSVNFTYPLLILILLPILFFTVVNRNDVFVNKFLLIFLTVPFIFIALMPLSDVRYIIGLLPLGALYYAKLYIFFARAWKPLGLIFLVLLSLTNVFSAAPFIVANNDFSKSILLDVCEKVIERDFLFQMRPGWDKNERCKGHVQSVIDPEKTGLKFPLFYYFYELSHDYEGPVEVVSKYLNENGNKNDIVFTNFEGGSIIFYTGMVAPHWSQYRTLKEKPRWIIPRMAFPLEREYLVELANEYNATRIELPVVDQLEENYPSLYNHRFWTKQTGKLLVIYRVDGR